jgi:hypothetical protein
MESEEHPKTAGRCAPGWQKERVMSLPINRIENRLPKRFPVGATYVVEGYGGDEGSLRVIARYIVLPGGRRINVPADLAPLAAPRAPLPLRRGAGAKQPRAKGRSQGGGKKIAARGGVA